MLESNNKITSKILPLQFKLKIPVIFVNTSLFKNGVWYMWFPSLFVSSSSSHLSGRTGTTGGCYGHFLIECGGQLQSRRQLYYERVFPFLTARPRWRRVVQRRGERHFPGRHVERGSRPHSRPVRRRMRIYFHLESNLRPSWRGPWGASPTPMSCSERRGH